MTDSLTLEQLDAKVSNLLIKHVPISEERLDKMWIAVRDTMNEYAAKLTLAEVNRTKQNEKINTLTKEVEALRQQVIVMTVQQPTNHDNAVNDLGMRVLELERGGADS